MILFQAYEECVQFRGVIGMFSRRVECGRTGKGFKIKKHSGGEDTYLIIYDVKLC